jgi:hypothetical protein
MALKDLFNDDEPINIVPKQSLISASKEVESVDFLLEFNKDKKRYIPQVDYNDPSKFAFFGSAEEYYVQAIKHIRDDYPYDGSYKERLEWKNNATYIDLYFFDKRYPRTNGYIYFAKDGWGDQSTSVKFKTGALSMSLPATQEYILFKGGPNVDNIYDPDKNREENLKLDLSGSGVTVEFWAKINAVTPVSSSGGSDSVVLFDLWNGRNTDKNDYGRFSIGLNNNLSGSSTSIWFVHAVSGSTGAAYQSGTAGFFDNFTQSELEDNQWHHYAFTAYNSGSNLQFELYVDGAWKDGASIVGEAINKVTGSMLATLGASVAFPDWTTSGPGTGTSPSGRGYGKFSGSIDEFRFWKTRRNAKQIGRYYRSQVGGGTNTDESNTDLGVYFKFNEGVVGNSANDAVVLDYSGRLSNGAWVGYTSGYRSTGSAIVESDAATQEWLDPIVKSSHPDVANLLTTMTESGSLHDLHNSSYLYFSYPTWAIEEDEETEGNLKILTHIMGSYLDTLHLQIDNLKTLKTKNYVSSSHKPHPHSNKLLTSVGFVAPNIFVDATVLEQFGKRSETVIFQEDLHNIKNTIYQNIYNNIDYIYKSKGTIKSFRNLLRCYGIDQELVKFNLYSNNATHNLETNYEGVSVKKNFADFNDVDRNVAIIYQSSTFPGIADVYSNRRVLQTTECEVVFPRKRKENEKNYYYFGNLSSSLFGAMASGSNVSGAFSVYAVRGQRESSDVKFVLSSAFGYLTSSIYRNTYENQKWNFAVKVKPLLPKADIASFGDQDYIFQFVGINTVAGQVINEFSVSSSVDSVYVDDVLATNKRMYVGAAKTTISGTTLEKSDVRISSLRHWYTDVTNEELKIHGKDPYNFGLIHPYEDAGAGLLNVTNVPKIETLALNWDFQSASIPNSSGMFTVKDFSSGSTAAEGLYDFLGPIVKQKHDGVGRYYLENDSGSIDRDYVHAYKPKLPESLNSLDMISIGEDRDKVFTKESRPVDYFWSFEKSLYQNISEELLNVFASIKDFNNLIGEPVNRYRPEYKSLQKLRQLLFRKFESDINLERYIEFYKWVDSSLNMMLERLIPISANTSDKIRNVVESHVLERSKVWTKFPTLEMKQKDPEGQIGGINRFVNWQFNHHPLDGLASQDQNLQWWNERAERTKILTSGDTDLDSQKERLKEIIITQTTGSHVELYDQRTAASYEGSIYALKRSRPYKLSVDIDQTIKKPDPMFLDRIFTDSNGLLVATDASFKDKIDEEYLPDELKPIKLSDNIVYDSVASEKVGTSKQLPFLMVSSSVNTGYQSGLSFSIAIENHHKDRYGTSQVPMQGPFTEKFVGGHQSRHEEIDQSNTERTERYSLTEFAGYLSIVKHAATSHRPAVYRDGLAKRPVNIANHQYSTSSTAQIGNFQNNYEVVMTSGRAQNNLWFRKQNGVLSSSAQESTSVSGVIDFALPNRSTQKSVIVNRFSAPGDPSTMSRGYLDVESEEYSAYNQLNYRNLVVRQPLQTLLARHCEQFGIDSVNGSPNASFHKVNRNSLTRVEWSGSSSNYETGTVISASIKDNWYVQHQIPRSDRQYAWITASMQSWSPNGITDVN